MYILQNALKNLGRNKGRNILLGIIIFSIILTTTVALVINATTKEIITDYQNRFGSKVTLAVDFEKMMAESKPDENGFMAFPSATAITPKQYMAFADSKLLKSYQMDMTAGIIFKDLKAINEQKNNGMIGSIGGDKEYVSPKAKLLGYSDPNLLPDFKEGLRKIIDGQLYQKKNECLISSDFAKLNKLKVGDQIQVMDISSKKYITLTISGIYADATKAEGDLPTGAMSLQGSYGNRRNEILVDMKTMQENFDISGLVVNAQYELKSPKEVKDFEKELKEKGLPSEYKVTTDEASYNKIVAPVIGMANISLTFMWVILLVGGIILLFVTSMAIRERKYEIGVLRTMGLKKSKVAFMLVAEMVMITTICLGLGLGIGSAISQPVADTLIAGQVKATEKNQTNGPIFEGGSISIGGNTDPNAQPLTEIEVSLTFDATVQIVLIALLLALLSSIIGVIFITKYEPIKILSERN